jgi:hypothetical protein
VREVHPEFGVLLAAAHYVETVQHWLTWLLDLVSRVNLNPARPFRLKLKC